jgi:hypothetical protein
MRPGIDACEVKTTLEEVRKYLLWMPLRDVPAPQDGPGWLRDKMEAAAKRKAPDTE